MHYSKIVMKSRQLVNIGTRLDRITQMLELFNNYSNCHPSNSIKETHNCPDDQIFLHNAYDLIILLCSINRNKENSVMLTTHTTHPRVGTVVHAAGQQLI